MQAKGELGEDQLRALEMDVTGRVRALPLGSVSPVTQTRRVMADYASVLARDPVRGRQRAPRGQWAVVSKPNGMSQM